MKTRPQLAPRRLFQRYGRAWAPSILFMIAGLLALCPTTGFADEPDELTAEDRLLLARTADADPRVRLGAVGDLWSRVKNDRPSIDIISGAVIKSLRNRPKVVVPVLLDRLKDSSAPVRREAALTLMYYVKNDKVVPSLIKALEDPDRGDGPNLDGFPRKERNPLWKSVATYAAMALAEAPPEKGRDAVKPLLKLQRTAGGFGGFAPMEAAIALGKLAKADKIVAVEVLPKLIARVREEGTDDQLNRRAVIGLSHAGAAAKEAVPLLVETLTAALWIPNRVGVGHDEAIEALLSIGTPPPDAVPALIGVIAVDRGSHASKLAAIALGEIGPAAQPAVPLLRRLAAGDYAATEAAADALKKIARSRR